MRQKRTCRRDEGYHQAWLLHGKALTTGKRLLLDYIGVWFCITWPSGWERDGMEVH